MDEIWIGDVADRTVPTCRLDETIGEVRRRVQEDGRDTCVVVNDHGIVLGLLRKRGLESPDQTRVEEVMTSGPKTFRPNLTLQDLLSSMREHDVQTNSVVTTGDGRLLGIISRADAEATLSHEDAKA